MKITDVNVSTGEVIVRDATEAELNQMEIDKAEQDAKRQAAAEKAAARQALLAKLGITEEEAKLLLS